MSSATVTVYKVTGPNGEAHIARNGFKWPKPRGKRPGKWVHAQGELVACKNGLHACQRPLDILQHISAGGMTVWLAEAKGDSLPGSGKVVYRSLRLVRRLNFDERVARLFAADCAEQALLLVENPDARSVNAVVVARAFAEGNASAGDLDAARAAAGAAAWAAAGDAARDAWAAGAAARAAAGAAAWAAAGDAARAAAGDAARDWQNQRLHDYLHGEHQSIA